MRIKGIHILSESSTVNMIVSLFKQLFSKKVGERVQVHKTLDSLHKVVPREILPSDLGGEEVSIMELRGKILQVKSLAYFFNKLWSLNSVGNWSHL